MFQSFKLISLSHLMAPVTVREQMYLPETACKSLLHQISEVLDLTDAMVLSTCNRTEIYYNHENDLSDTLLKLLFLEKETTNDADLRNYFQVINDHTIACHHLFEVCMGLQSGVVGDLQISNQAKQAYSWANEYKLAGPFLHRLLHTIFHGNKRVHQETSYREGAASVSYASAELAKDLVIYHKEPKVLVIGCGEMGTDVVRNIADGPFSKIGISNRTPEKAVSLAAECSGTVIPFENLEEFLTEYDVIISTIGPEKPIISKQSFPAGEKFLNKFLIDLAVPRSIEEEVGEIPGLVLYNIDEISKKTEETIQKRRSSIPLVKKIIREELANFEEWLQELSISPIINRFKEAIENIRRDEVARVLKKVSKKEEALLNQVTKGMVNKIIKLPVLQLKAACKRGEEENLIGVLNDLFNLEANQEKEQV